MTKFLCVLITTTHRRLILILAWIASFAAVLTLVFGYALHKTVNVAQERTRLGAEQFLKLNSDLNSVFDLMRTQLTAVPCSPEFHAQLRRIAYLPDGLNEFIYAPGGKAECSTGVPRFATPVDFGPPDIDEAINKGVSLWIDRDLAFLGLAGETGTFAHRDPFVAVIPPRSIRTFPSPWLSMEMVLVAANGNWFHRGGGSGVYQRQLTDSGLLPLLSGRTRNLVCDSDGVRCVAVEADLAALAATEKTAVMFLLFGAGLIATYASKRLGQIIAGLCSFEARFRRHLNASSIICAYQPVMRLQNGEIIGCEVLARWQDVDGAIVFPDRFIPIVERHDMTMQLTRLVAERAFEELSSFDLHGRRLKVSFNIFPRDLDCERLLDVFASFMAQQDRFQLVLEITESNEMPEDAQGQIEALRRAGVRIYIDDFGAGYANMGNLAALSVDGVKLDRSFAMAPEGSMMAQMLRHAIEMIQTAGRIMVVEGVETAERLALLRSMPTRIDYVQGYHIARPLDIAAFSAFIGSGHAPAKQPGHIQGA